MIGAVAAMNYVIDGDAMTSVQLGVYEPNRKEYSLTADPIWCGNTTRTPVDEELVIHLGFLLSTLAANGALPLAVDMYSS